MKKYIARISFILLIFVFFACNNGKKEQTTENVTEAPQKIFIMTPIPPDLKTAKDRADFLAEHYWDNFDFRDTVYLNSPDVIDQAVVTYLEVLMVADAQLAQTSVRSILEKAAVNDRMLASILSFYKRYLYDPNSPIRNEELYIPVLQYLVDNEKNEGEKERARFDLDMLMKNRVGEKATDITYTLASGNTGNLYGLRGDYTILMFYNPDCEACAQTIDMMKSTPVISKLIELKSLSVLTFYPDADLTAWKNHFNDIPSTWVNGYDKGRVVETKRLYDLKAIPTLYLLDRDKKVVLKDAPVNQIISYLANSNPMLLGGQ